MADRAWRDIGGALWDCRWSAMFKRKTQGVEAYMLGEGGLDWFKQGASGAFPSGLARI